MFIVGQDLVKKELVKRFSFEDFTWTDDIFPKEEDKQEEERIENLDWVFAENVIDVKNVNVIEAREEKIEDIPPPM